MKIFVLSPVQLLSMLLMVFVAACSSDDEGGDPPAPTTAELLVGTWTTSTVEVSAMVGDQTLLDYLINEVGMSPTDAAVANALFESALEDEVTGSLTINADNTYESNFNGGSDSGTWSLSSDETMLILLEGTDVIEITINSLSETIFNGTSGDTFMVDLDNDPGTPDVEVMVEATVNMTR